MKRRAVYAALHGGFFVPNTGSFTETLPPQNKTLEKFEMNLLDNGCLELTWIQDRNPKTFVIGAATVKGVLLAPTPAEPKADKKQ